MVIKLYWVRVLLSQRTYYSTHTFSFIPLILLLPFISGCQTTPEQNEILDPDDVEAHLRNN